MKINSIQQIIDKYRENNADLKMSTDEQILSIMLARKDITQSEYQAYINGGLFEFDQVDIGYDIAQNMGLNYSSQKGCKNYVEKRLINHKETSLVLVDENENIDDNQFTLSAIKERYSEDKYIVKKEIIPEEYIKEYDLLIPEKTRIAITNKDTNRLEIEYEKNNYEIIVKKFDSKENLIEEANVDIGVSLLGLKNYGQMFISSITKYSNEEINLIDYEYHSNNIEKTQKSVKKGFDTVVISETNYINGKPYKTTNENKAVKNKVVEDIIHELNNKNMLGGIKDVHKLEQIIKIYINKVNVYEILTDYENKTGTDFIDDIKNAIENNNKGLNNIFSKKIDKNLILEHMYKCMSPGHYRTDIGDNSKEVQYITKRLIEDFNGKRDDLMQDLSLILSKGDGFLDDRCYVIDEVLEELYKKTNQGLLETLYKNDKFNKENLFKIFKQIFYGVNNLENDSVKNEITSMINNEDLMNLLFEESGTYYEDIKTDILHNKDNIEKVFIDIKRLFTRGKCAEDKGNIITPNGKIDTDFKQGLTGDCWLLAGLISICKKPAGEKYVESLLQVDKQTNDVKVNLKGVNKTYNITYDEIKNSGYLSGGDGDIRALELAIDKYIKELAYNGDSDNINIEGNTTEYLYSLLFGESEKSQGYERSKRFNFNSQKDYYCIGTSLLDIDDSSCLKDIIIKENGQTENFVTGHAYAILKSDGNYVYLINPWASNEVLKISHEDLMKIKPQIGHAKIK